MLHGIIPIVFCPFMPDGSIDEVSLRRVVRFELDGDCDAIGVNGFATEAYKLSEAERIRCAEIVVDEVGDAVPLVIGIAPGSTEVAIQQAKSMARFQPAALMTLPPGTMQYDESALVDYYVDLGNAADAPIMIQQSPHYPGFSATRLPVESMAEIADRCQNVRYFKIEGPGSAERIGGLRKLVGDQVALFGGVGGIALQAELKQGAAGLLPGVGFNEYFVRVWKAWTAGDYDTANLILTELQPLVEAVSGKGHEYSLHVRKYLMQRAGYIDHVTVRRPTVDVPQAELEPIGALADKLDLRISRQDTTGR
ncbi:MAG TPA: dihydrodipicolinate synthase family protein [Aggregatilineales bacterium]|nr:dihydrodipicolinate synthase family protein [Aggregatilineales bacterium]